LAARLGGKENVAVIGTHGMVPCLEAVYPFRYGPRIVTVVPSS